MVLEPTTGGISMLYVTETHNMRDSSGEIYGIAGQLFLLPIIGFLLGITIGVICEFALGFNLCVGLILGLLNFCLARFLSKKHKGWFMYFFNTIKAKIWGIRTFSLYVGRTHNK